MTNPKAVPPKHPNPGHCVVCGVDVAGTRWYCEDHRPAKAASIPKARKATAEKLAPAGSSRSRTTPTGKVTDERAKATLAKLLIILTVMVATARLRRANIPDPSGQLAEELSLTNDEGTAIAAPIARWSNSTVIGAKVISPVARNEDVVTALYALYQYNRRTQVFIDLHRRGDLAPVVPINANLRDHSGAPVFDGPVTPAREQVIVPEEPMAPPEVMAQTEPLRFTPDGLIEGNL